MPTARERFVLWGRTIFRVLGQNRVGQAGVVVTTATGISMVFLWIIEILQGGHQHPYSGIILFLILPAIFVAGPPPDPGRLRPPAPSRPEGGHGRASLPPPIDLGSPKIRRVLTFVAIATLANATLVGFASYKGLEVMDSVGFCGEVVPHGDGAGAGGLPGFAPLAHRLRRVPHRGGRLVVRQVEALGDAPGPRGGAEDLFDARSRPRSTSSGPRARPASSATGRSDSPATASSSSGSTPRTRRTPS